MALTDYVYKFSLSKSLVVDLLVDQLFAYTSLSLITIHLSVLMVGDVSV